jgi:hypothetical protein
VRIETSDGCKPPGNIARIAALSAIAYAFDPNIWRMKTSSRRQG